MFVSGLKFRSETNPFNKQIKSEDPFNKIGQKSQSKPRLAFGRPI